jgi:ferric-dicitrate binding protein FerR (iron transport regulator)
MMEEHYNLAKWLNNELEGEELKAFEASEDFALYQKIKHYSAELKTPDFDENKMLQNILQTKKTKSISIQKVVLRIAAVVILSFGITFAVKNFANFTEYALNGSTTEFLLPDNSTVLLNSGSEIEYKKWNWNNERKLTLDGEAYFKVAKGKKFEVNTEIGKVTVLGTQFNVKSRANRLDVTCYEGKVQVNYQNQLIILTPGKTVAFESGNLILDEQTQLTTPGWLQKQMEFSKEQLTAVVEEIKRQYKIEIEIKTPPTQQRFTGVIPTDNLEATLDIIATTYHLKINKTGNNQYSLE